MTVCPIPDFIADILARFDGAGVEAFCVGGCVRDALRGVPPHDWDLCTAARPEETRALFCDCAVIETGIRHGTVTVLWPPHPTASPERATVSKETVSKETISKETISKETISKETVSWKETFSHETVSRIPVEITTYRVDGDYQGHRAPKQVTFSSSLAEDCRRRDFTVNAMAYHPTLGLHDFFGGREDLEHRVLRCVGDPAARFSEDALRILRALRFSSVLDFTVDGKTAEAIHACSRLLLEISGERIVAEWKKLLTGSRAAEILSEYRDVTAVFLPALSRIPEPNRLAGAFAYIKEEKKRMAAVLYLCDIKTADDARTALSPLPFDRAFSDGTARLVGMADLPIPATRYDMRQIVSQFGADDTRSYLRIKHALFPESAGLCTAALACLDTVLADRDPVRVTDLAVNGADLASLGFRGKEIGDALAQLLDCVMREEIANERTSLLETARRMKG